MSTIACKIDASVVSPPPIPSPPCIRTDAPLPCNAIPRACPRNGHPDLDSQRTDVPTSHPAFGPRVGATIGFVVCLLPSTVVVSTPDVFLLETVQWSPECPSVAHHGCWHDRGSHAEQQHDRDHHHRRGGGRERME